MAEDKGGRRRDTVKGGGLIGALYLQVETAAVCAYLTLFEYQLIIIAMNYSFLKTF